MFTISGCGLAVVMLLVRLGSVGGLGGRVTTRYAAVRAMGFKNIPKVNVRIPSPFAYLDIENRGRSPIVLKTP